VVHAKSSQRLREDEAEDGRVNANGCIILFYPYFIIFIVLDPSSISVFWMGL
jgi:hypothetical protein